MQGVSLRICLLLKVQGYPGHHSHLRLTIKKTADGYLKGGTYRNSWEREEMALDFKTRYNIVDSRTHKSSSLQKSCQEIITFIMEIYVLSSNVLNPRLRDLDHDCQSQCYTAD